MHQYVDNNVTVSFFISTVIVDLEQCIYITRQIVQIKDATISMHMLSCLGGQKVTLQTAARKVPGSYPGGFLCWFLFCCCCYCFYFYFLGQNIIDYITFCNSFCNVSSFNILNIRQHSWPIIMESRYRPSIFNVHTSLTAWSIITVHLYCFCEVKWLTHWCIYYFVTDTSLKHSCN